MGVDYILKMMDLSLKGLLIIGIPILTICKKIEIDKKQKAIQEQKEREEKERQLRLEFYQTTSELNKIEIENKK